MELVAKTNVGQTKNAGYNYWHTAGYDKEARGEYKCPIEYKLISKYCIKIFSIPKSAVEHPVNFEVDQETHAEDAHSRCFKFLFPILEGRVQFDGFLVDDGKEDVHTIQE